MLNDHMRFATQERRLGHENITITANTYGQLYKGKTDDADAIDQLLQQEGE